MLRTIKNCKLFSGLQEEDIKNALSFFHSVNESFAKNTIIKKPNDILSAFGLVLSGAVTVFMDDFDGNRLVMSRAVPGETFGESLCFLQKRSQVYIMATEQTEILWLHCDPLFNNSESDFALNMRNRFIALLASRALDMNDRIQILSKYTIREKLITYFSQCSARAAADTFIIPLDRASLAAYLGTERSALSRELHKMKNENIITIEKNKITLIHQK